MRIPVPTELPRRADGARLRALSASSLALLHRCPELWRRRYLALERPPRSGAQHLGAAVDAGASAAWRARMAGEEEPEAALAAYAEAFERPGGEVDFGLDGPRELRERGRAALRAYLAAPAARVVPVAVQREFALALAPGLSWSLIGRIDLETEDAAIDLKVKARHLGPAEAERSLQASLYLAARRAEGLPAARFAFHSLRHGSAPELRVVPTGRDPRRLDGALARVALAARLIAALAERLGPEGPWPLADPEGWACSRRWCPAYGTCPGGAGPR